MPSTVPSADVQPTTSAADAPQPAEGGLRTRGHRALGWVMVVAGAAGLVAALILSVEKYRLAVDPGYVPSCDLNPVVSCGSVMDTAQASAFGIPNSLIGIAAFAVVVTVGVTMLAGFRPPGWVWAGLQVGVTAGMVFVLWLITQSLYVIGALCPYCMLVWLVTFTVFWFVTVATLDRVVTGAAGRRLVDGLHTYRPVPVVAFAAVVVVLATIRFWDYWRTVL